MEGSGLTADDIVDAVAAHGHHEVPDHVLLLGFHAKPIDRVQSCLHEEVAHQSSHHDTEQVQHFKGMVSNDTSKPLGNTHR